MSTAFAKFTPRTGVLPALSISQPWSYLIVNGLKDIENRDWKTDYRGPLLIHAGKKIDAACFDGDDLYLPSLIREGANVQHTPRRKADYLTGGIIGRATLVDVVTSSKSPWFVGRYGFVLKDAHPIDFIPYRGELGLFDVPESEIEPKKSLDEILAELAEASQKKSKREHKPHFWQEPNAPVWVTIDKVTYAAVVLDHAHMGDFNGDWCKVELTRALKDWNNQPIVQKWVHPKPIQSYKLRKREV